MVNGTNQLEHCKPIKLKILKILSTTASSSSSSSGVATSLVSSPAASSNKKPNSLIAEVDVKSIKFHARSTTPLSPKSSAYSDLREPEGASAEELSSIATSTGRLSSTASRSSKQRSEAIIKARGTAAGGCDDESEQHASSTKKKQQRQQLDEFTDEGNFHSSSNASNNSQTVMPENNNNNKIKQNLNSRNDNILCKVERLSDGRRGNLLLYGDALADQSLLGADKCFVFNNLLQYRSSKKSQAHNIQLMMGYPLRTSIVEISQNQAAISQSSPNNANNKLLSSPTASSNSLGIQSSYNRKSTTTTATRKLDFAESTTITRHHHHHHHHWVVNGGAAQRAKIEAKVEHYIMSTSDTLALRTSKTTVTSKSPKKSEQSSNSRSGRAGFSSSRGKHQPSASQALAKTLETDNITTIPSQLQAKKQPIVTTKDNYRSTKNQKASSASLFTSSVNTSSPTSSSSLLSQQQSSGIYQKLPIIPSALLESQNSSSSAFRRFHSRSSSVPRSTNY